MSLDAATAASPVSARADLLRAFAEGDPLVRSNRVLPIIIVIAIVVLLVLATSVVAAAIVLCAQHGGVLDGVASIDTWTVKVTCHKL